MLPVNMKQMLRIVHFSLFKASKELNFFLEFGFELTQGSPPHPPQVELILMEFSVVFADVLGMLCLHFFLSVILPLFRYASAYP